MIARSFLFVASSIAVLSIAVAAPAGPVVQEGHTPPRRDRGQEKVTPPDMRPGGSSSSSRSSADVDPEAGRISNPRQLTFPEQYVKAGESYLSPDGSTVVFQAVEALEDGSAPDDFYAMFVASVVRDEEGRIVGLENHRRLSPEGSANTCGWFHPTDPNTVIFATTMGSPTASAPPGYQRGSGRYRWMFPPEMRIVSCDLRTADGSPESLTPLVPHEGAYMAECSYSPDGRHLVYCSLQSNQGDLYVLDTVTGRSVAVVDDPGYDGGPFFSPDGRRLCYRSDRNGDNHLQLFVAELAFDENGAITGVDREYQLTNNLHVNWCPFWHPDGRHLVYASSEAGHRNYEVFIVDADPGVLEGSPGPVRYGTNARRVTEADGADVLPAFSADGSTMIWTGQRGDDRSSQLWIAEFDMELDPMPRPYDPSRHR